MVNNYDDFIKALMDAGFSMAGGGNDGIFAVINHGWNEEVDSPIHWHTGDPETDPWEWRMRVLDERDDISYSKVFFKKAGFITREWYPYFLSARRGGLSFEDTYEKGEMSHFAKRIFEVVEGAGTLPVPEIKRAAGFGKDDKSAFDKALTELQMGMFITICGRKHNPNNSNWSATVFCTTEHFWGAGVFEEADNIPKEIAAEKIKEQILRLNPDATDKKIQKFIFG
ncbi:MAG: hypothetical protein FWB98_06315 [Defluviitaleaceae bacterium]|nr:hypothetical protein [Defluviitaleaceae bacterium]